MILHRSLLLSLRVPSKIASAASLLSVLSTSPATLVTPTPEPFFGFFTLLSLCFLSSPVVSTSSSPLSSWRRPSLLRVTMASVCIALATVFRANGVMLVGHLWYALLWQRPRRESRAALFARLLLVPISTAVAIAPLILNQIWAWKRFCLDTLHPRPWCGHSLPYSFVQSHYW